MTYQEPAPRYSRPIPASKLPPLDAPLPRNRRAATLPEAVDDLDQAVRQLGRAIVAALHIDAAVHALSLALERERSDRMLRIGAALGILAALAVTAALASI